MARQLTARDSAVTVTVYLNDARTAGGFAPATAALRLALTFELDARVTGDPRENVHLILSAVFEQLNIGGDLIAASDYTERYRAAGNRSLSVGDVVVVGESAFTVGRRGFDPIACAALSTALAASVPLPAT
jgi:hypothetical protein